MTLHLTGYLDIDPSCLEEIRAAMPDHIRLSRAEPGCLSFELRFDRQCSTRLLVEEVFCDRAAFEAHQARMLASPWAEITRGIARHYQISETP